MNGQPGEQPKAVEPPEHIEMAILPRSRDLGARLALPPDHEERGAYLIEGRVDIGGESYAPGQLLVFRPKAEITLAAPEGARLMLLGGEPLDEPRHIWWNFVSSSKERIEAAKADWRAGRFAAVIGDSELIPLPE
jgi:redox-sensitive bicupin YhaK (pirin superfamily)